MILDFLPLSSKVSSPFVLNKFFLVSSPVARVAVFFLGILFFKITTTQILWKFISAHSCYYRKTSGFWPRVRARALRAPVFLGSLLRPTGRCAHPRPSQLRCFLFTPLSLGPNSGRQGRLSFHWSKLHLTELHCILLSYSPPSWAPLHLNELHCTLMSYTVPY